MVPVQTNETHRVKSMGVAARTNSSRIVSGIVCMELSREPPDRPNVLDQHCPTGREFRPVDGSH